MWIDRGTRCGGSGGGWHRAGRELVFLPGKRPVWLIYDGGCGVLPSGFTPEQIERGICELIVQIVEASIGRAALERRMRYHDFRALLFSMTTPTSRRGAQRTR